MEQKITPDENDLWLKLTRYVCARDMQGLNYYKEDLLNGLNEIMGKENSETYGDLIKKEQAKLLGVAIKQNNQQQ